MADVQAACPPHRAGLRVVEELNTVPPPAEWRVAVDGDEISAQYEPVTDEHAVFVCAHGAGGHMRDRSMERLSSALRGRGLSIVRFNFLYCEHGSRRPDDALDRGRRPLVPRAEGIADDGRGVLDEVAEVSAHWTYALGAANA